MTNPKSGRPVDDVARDYDEEAVEVFATIMRDPIAENRDRLRAAENLLERGHGKSVTPIEVRPGTKLRDQLASMSTDQLYEIVNREQLPRLAGPVIDAVVEEDIDPLLR